MATWQSGDANIIEEEGFNWRLVVYPVVAATFLIMGGLIYYFYLQNQREVLEVSAREALLQAKTPEALVAVADKFPATLQASLALLSAAGEAFDQKDYDAAGRDYQRVIDNSATDPQLRESAQMGLASALEAGGKTDDAIKAYLTVARRGNDSAYAPAAYNAVASIYRRRGDKTHEEEILIQAASLDPSSGFVKEAHERLQELSAAIPMPTTSNAVPTAPKP